MPTLRARLDRLEVLWSAGDCPVCRGKPPYRVLYVDDWGAERGLETPACLGCRGVQLIEVAFVDERRQVAP
jgi:hypothetical protein